MALHNGDMPKPVTRDAERRSAARRAEITLRMSRAQREGLRRVADARGETVTALLLAVVEDLVPDAQELQDAS